MAQLVKPSVKYEKEYLLALDEAKDDIGDTLLIKPSAKQSFENFIQELDDNSKGINMPAGKVPSTTLWLIDNDEFIGRLSIRHELNKKLLQHGGHIGYYIRKSKRGKGYGKLILQLGLEEARKIGISKALITCDYDNIASRKIIEENGGVLENIITLEEDRKLRRYWIAN